MIVLAAALSPMGVAGAAPGATTAADLHALPVERGYRVSYVSDHRVYLEGGRDRGLEEGVALELRRDDAVVASLEVEFVAEHSASCRVVEGSEEPTPGDRVFLASAGPAAAAPRAAVDLRTSSSGGGAPLPFSLSGGAAPAPRMASAEAATLTAAPQPPPGRATAIAASSYQSAESREPWARASGSFVLGLRGFDDQGSYDRGWSETSGRLSLRLLDLGQRPWTLRARLRRREIARDRGWSARNPRDESDDRFYELSLVYEPPESRVVVHLGRLGASPFVGLGTLDGALGQVRVTRHLAVGGFYGSAAEVQDLGFESLGDKYGAYARLFSAPPGEGSTSSLVADVVIGYLGEYDGGEVSREYAVLETRLRGGNRWHLFQRAELDLQGGWREELTGRSSQLSNLSFSTSYRLNGTLRLLASYDQVRPYRDAENRDTPEEVFDDEIRQGLRAGVAFGGARGLRGTAMAGVRRRQDQGDSTTSLQTSLLYSTRSRLFYGADLSGWNGDASDGYLLSAHLGRTFSGGHDLRLTLGHSSTSAALLDATRTQDWIRIGGRLELPARLYLYGEVEHVSGDDREGERLLLDLGYRF